MSCPNDRALASNAASFAIVSADGGDGVGDGDGVALGVAEGDGLGARDPLGDGDVVGDGEIDDAEGLTLAAGEATGDVVGLALAVGCGVGLAGGGVGEGVVGPSALAGDARSQPVVARAIAGARKIRIRTSQSRLPHRA
jgi:hypothetical protein